MNNCRHVQKIRPSSNHSVLNPQKWHCIVCSTSENIWACLSCSHVACGKYLDEHIVHHYNATKHPLSMNVHDKYVYCYDCKEYILNDNTSGDIKILRNCLQTISLEDVSTSLNTSIGSACRRSNRVQRSASFVSLLHLPNRCDVLEGLDEVTYTELWFRRYYLLANCFNKWKLATKSLAIEQSGNEESSESMEVEEEVCSGKRLRERSSPVLSNSTKRRRHTIPGVTGLQNLGNTCYMNSILQVLRHLSHFSKFFIGDGYKQNRPLSSSAASTSGATSTSTLVNSLAGVSGQLQSSTSSTDVVEFSSRVNGHASSSSQPSALNCASPANGDVPSVRRQKASRKRTPTKLSLSHELNSLLRIMWSGKMSMVSPHKMLYAVWNIIPFFRGYSQQDAQEFLSEFLDKVQSEMDGNAFKTPGLLNLRLVPSDSASNNAASSSCMATSNDDVVTQLFQGELVSQVKCLTCGYQSDRREAFMDLSLEFPIRFHSRLRSTKKLNEGCNLEEMLAKFMAVEKLDGRIYACDECNKNRRKSSGSTTTYTEAEKCFMISRLPHVLRLHLKRFIKIRVCSVDWGSISKRWSGRSSKGKIGVNVAFMKQLDVRNFCHPDVKSDGFIYNLSAVVMHHGRGFGSGHYTAYCWNDDADSWLHCNDAKMQKVSLDEVYKAQAYILIYTKNLPNGFGRSPSQSLSDPTHINGQVEEEKSKSRIPKFADVNRRLKVENQGTYSWKRTKTTIW